MAKAKRAAIYLRVSTDDQTVENQRRELTAAATATVVAGWSSCFPSDLPPVNLALAPITHASGFVALSMGSGRATASCRSR